MLAVLAGLGLVPKALGVCWSPAKCGANGGCASGAGSTTFLVLAILVVAAVAFLLDKADEPREGWRVACSGGSLAELKGAGAKVCCCAAVCGFEASGTLTPTPLGCVLMILSQSNASKRETERERVCVCVCVRFCVDASLVSARECVYFSRCFLERKQIFFFFLSVLQFCSFFSPLRLDCFEASRAHVCTYVCVWY